MLFDSHAHLDDEQFDADRAAVIARAQEAGVAWMINPGSDAASSAAAVALAEQYPFLYAAVGIHPHDAQAAGESDYARLAEWLDHPKVVAIGEIGLDYHYDFSPRDVQQTAFVRQLELAREANRPVIIHDREAHGDTMQLIRQQGRGVRGVFHCYSGSWEMAHELLKMGFYLSFGGSTTFRNAARVREVVRQVPLDRLLLETDCPYLTPHPYRGKRNEPAFVRLVAEEIARLRGLDMTELACRTTENVRRLFAIPA